MNRRILLVEDEQSLGYLLAEYLKMKQFDVTWAKDGLEALELLTHYTFDLAILDIMMPKMDGFALAERMQLHHIDLPFIFLTARSMKIDVLKGFALGAVDYLKKPIDEDELVVRIETLLNRLVPQSQIEMPNSFQVGLFTIDSINQKLIYNNDVRTMTTRETELLQILAANTNNLCTHDDILLRLWGDNDYFNKKSLNVFITRLRNYLKADENVLIENIHGKGFILKVLE